MIIDIHSHVTAPLELGHFQAGLFAARSAHGRRPRLTVSDERVEDALNAPTFRGPSHLRRLKDVGTDLQLISPRPFTLAHYAEPHSINEAYVAANNDLIAQQVRLHPDVFRGVGALPQEPGASPNNCVEELERCVSELGFVGCLITPIRASVAPTKRLRWATSSGTRSTRRWSSSTFPASSIRRAASHGGSPTVCTS